MPPSSAKSDSATVVNSLFLFLSIFSSAPIAVGYGLLLRFMAGGFPGVTAPNWLDELIAPLSAAFLFLGPLAIGALTVAFAPPNWRTSMAYAVGVSLANCALWLVVVLALNWEVAICILMAVPIVLPLAAVGGMLMWTVFKVVKHTLQSQVVLVMIVLLPYLLGPIESRFPIQDSLHTVDTSLIIHADADTVWRTLVRVPEIQPSERDFRWFHFFGMPWPLAANLDRDGVGGTRLAQYENGLRLMEPVTEWQPGRVFSFDIEILQPENLPPPYNQMGGPVFAPLRATFFIEPLDTGQVRVRLISQHRLATRFNTYGGWWTEFFMADLQNHMLHVIQLRAEGE